MCGRYGLETEKIVLVKRFGASLDFEYKPHYNIAPTTMNPVLTEIDNAAFSLMKWGMTPKWMEGRPLINVRVETLKEKKTFAKHLAERRVLIPATAFYEWQKDGEMKFPYRIHVPSSEVIAFAGVYDDGK